MMKVFVVPVEGIKIRNPVTMAHVPAEGLEVEDSSYWRKQAARGSVTIKPVDTSEPKPKKARAKHAEGDQSENVADAAIAKE